MTRAQLLCLTFQLILVQLTHASEPFLAGAATTDITPPIGFPMWGYAARRDAPSVGVRDRLQARAVVMVASSQQLAIVSLDLGRAPNRQSMPVIRNKLKSAGIDHVLLVASHTHHGPVLELDTWPDPKSPYTRDLERRLVDVILAAAKNARPARWGVASAQTDLNRNRQSKRPDPPVDRTLTVVRIEATDGKPIAHLVNFAAHPTMLEARLHQFSADFVGAMAATVEKETGAPCLFLQGAAGDLSAKPPEGVRGPDAFGRALATEVLAVDRRVKCLESKGPSIKVVTEDFRFAARLDVSSPLVKAALGTAFFPELIAAYEREYRDGVRPQLTVAMLDDRLGIVGVSGELFCGHALSLRRRARLDQLLVCGYCNDYHQYFPTIEAVAEGGYGTAPPVGMAELGAGERIMDRALVHLYKLRGLLP